MALISAASAPLRAREIPARTLDDRYPVEESTQFRHFNPAALERARQGIFPVAELQQYTRNYQAAGGTRSFSDYYTAAYGPSLVGVLLTGANMDGAEGMAAIQALGGLTIVQHPGEAEVATMPEAAIARRQPDHVLNLKDIPQMLLSLAKPGAAA